MSLLLGRSYEMVCCLVIIILCCNHVMIRSSCVMGIGVHAWLAPCVCVFFVAFRFLISFITFHHRYRFVYLYDYLIDQCRRVAYVFFYCWTFFGPQECCSNSPSTICTSTAVHWTCRRTPSTSSVPSKSSRRKFNAPHTMLNFIVTGLFPCCRVIDCELLISLLLWMSTHGVRWGFVLR